MAAALRGNLDDFGIAEIFQLIGHQRKTGILDVNGPKNRMRVVFDHGALAWAQPAGDGEHGSLGRWLVRCGLIGQDLLEEKLRQSRASARSLPDLLKDGALVEEEDIDAISDLMTRETLFELMGLTGGSFEFLTRPVSHDVPSEKLMVAEQVLMDGMRMQDEWQTFADRVPAQGDVLEALAPVDDYCQRLDDAGQGGSERVRLVFHFINGANNVRQIIDLSRLGTFTVSRILADLRSSGLVEVARPSLDPGRKRRRNAMARVSGFARLALAAGIPLVLLALLTLGLFLQQPPPGLGQGRSIVYRPLEEARAQFARQRLHNLLEARRHGTGLWPHSLDFLAQDAWEGGQGLTFDSASAYYYMRRGDGIVLLAPRR